MPRTLRRLDPSSSRPEDGLADRYRRACQVRDEFADCAWALFLLRIECALADEASRECMDEACYPHGGRGRFPWRRVRRFMIEVLRALPSLFWGLLCAASYPMLQVLLTLVVTMVVNLLVAAFALYCIYKLLTVW